MQWVFATKQKTKQSQQISSKSGHAKMIRHTTKAVKALWEFVTEGPKQTFKIVES